MNARKFSPGSSVGSIDKTKREAISGFISFEVARAAPLFLHPCKQKRDLDKNQSIYIGKVRPLLFFIFCKFNSFLAGLVCAEIKCTVQ